LLSGGQRQALSLLMATLVKPELLLLDEHTAALDPKTSAKIMELTNQIVTTSNITTLMITHNLSQAITYGNRLIMLHDGHVVLDISGDEKKQLTPEKLLHQFEQNIGGQISDELLFS
ncbi:ATP-binding cassette domain-containing protein, partial [Turicibacter sanguinis]|nr:ATP-binding cassette domain-containing protein [Turicibacter sanguinis]